jgi:hypothetical protein
MSTAQSTAGGSNGAREFGPGEWANTTWRRRGWGATRWTAFEIVAMLLGFFVFWPIGVAILGYKFWQGRHGGADLQTFAADKWREARSAWGASRPYSCGAWRRGGGFYGASTGNSAFDEWKAAELDRLEAERRKLEEAHREFAEFVENLRKSKDREEFERLMNARNRPQA